MAESQAHRVPPASRLETFADRSADGEAQSADPDETADADCVELSSEPECSALAERIRDQTAQGASTESSDTRSDAPRPGDPTEETTEQSAPNESDVEGVLYKLIWSQWVDICPPNERAEHPPRRFVISSELIRTIVQRRVDVPIERLAWVCAMVIGDRAIGHAGIDAHIYRGDEESERQDGAKAMRAALKRSAGGPRLHYWSLPNGTIEFAQIGYHDMALS